MQASNVALTARALKVGYPNREVAGPLDFQIEAQQCVFLVGENGSGKSTVLKTLVGALAPLEGQISLPMRATYLPASHEISAGLKGWDILDLLGAAGSPSGDQYRWPSARELSKTTDFKNLYARSLQSLSSGQRQKLLMMGALGNDSPIVVLDEPLSFLDWRSSLALAQLIKLDLDQGRSFFVASHELPWALRIPNSHMWVLDQGRICAAGPSTEVLISAEVSRVFNVRLALTDNPLDQTKLLATTEL